MKPPSPPPTTTSTTTTKATTRTTTTTTTAGAQANGLISMNFSLQFCTGQGRENTGNDVTVKVRLG
jgi:hypothetical protein